MSETQLGPEARAAIERFVHSAAARARAVDDREAKMELTAHVFDAAADEARAAGRSAITVDDVDRVLARLEPATALAFFRQAPTHDPIEILRRIRSALPIVLGLAGLTITGLLLYEVRDWLVLLLFAMEVAALVAALTGRARPLIAAGLALTIPPFIVAIALEAGLGIILAMMGVQFGLMGLLMDPSGRNVLRTMWGDRPLSRERNAFDGGAGALVALASLATILGALRFEHLAAQCDPFLVDGACGQVSGPGWTYIALVISSAIAGVAMRRPLLLLVAGGAASFGLFMYSDPAGSALLAAGILLFTATALQRHALAAPGWPAAPTDAAPRQV